ncbi:hypothetical protein Tco_0032672 [Tanacetum coccineum]
MSNMSEDIQYAGSDTRPPMLDRTDFESWQQRIRLYCLGKDNGENIMKSITEGPFQMGTMRDTLTEGGEGALHLGPERARVFADLSAEQKDRYKADIRATNILLQGSYLHLIYLIESCSVSLTNTLALLNQSFKAHLPQMNNQLRTSSNERNKATVQDGKVVVQDVRGRYNANISREDHFQVEQYMRKCYSWGCLESMWTMYCEADQCDAFDSDVDEVPTIQTMFVVNLSSEDPIYDEAGPSYDSNTLFEVHKDLHNLCEILWMV